MKRASVPTDIFKAPRFTKDRNGRFHDVLGRFVSHAAVLGKAAMQSALFDAQPVEAVDAGGVFNQGIPSPAAETLPRSSLPGDELWLDMPSRQRTAALHMAATALAA